MSNTDQKPTHIIVILDESGSMDCVRQRTISGLNEFLGDQKKEQGRATFSISKFNTTVTQLFDNVPLQTFEPLTYDHYQPGGMTAMYDAIGMVVSKYKHDTTHDYIVVILTDGEDNQSKEYSQFAINVMIKEMRGKDWQFVFLGANQDSFKEGGKLGIQHNVQYTYNDMSECFTNVNEAVKVCRKSKIAGAAAFNKMSTDSYQKYYTK